MIPRVLLHSLAHHLSNSYPMVKTRNTGRKTREMHDFTIASDTHTHTHTHIYIYIYEPPSIRDESQTNTDPQRQGGREI
jgi:hypothetical protein